MTITNKIALEAAIVALSNSTTNYRLAGEDTEFTPDEIINKINKMIEQIDKRKSASKPTKNQWENQNYAAQIMEYLADGKRVTATEILQIIPEMKSNQRVSAVLRALRIDGKIDKEVVKGKAMFFII